MTSKKPASSKRAAPPRAFDYTKAFQKDWEPLVALRPLRPASAETGHAALDRQRRTAWTRMVGSPTQGQLADHRECHIGGDFLLIYRSEGQTLIFVRAGTHSDLFED